MNIIYHYAGSPNSQLHGCPTKMYIFESPLKESIFGFQYFRIHVHMFSQQVETSISEHIPSNYLQQGSSGLEMKV